MLLVEKHCPKQLGQLDYHEDVTSLLRQMARRAEVPHLLVYGPPGSGKKTRIGALLRALYGQAAEHKQLAHKSFKVRSREIEVALLTSKNHIELDPSDAGLYDHVVVQEIIKEMAQSRNISALDAASNATKAKNFKVVVLHHVEKLSHAAQHALRRTMERYMSSCRLILCCDSVCKVTAPLRSRCLPVRVAAPTDEKVREILAKTLVAEGQRDVRADSPVVREIAEHSKGNLRKALLLLETAIVQADNSVLRPDSSVEVASWESFVSDMATLVLSEQTPKQLAALRDKCYQLLLNLLPPDLVLSQLAHSLSEKLPRGSCVDTKVFEATKHTALTRAAVGGDNMSRPVCSNEDMRRRVWALAAELQLRMCQGSKPILHLEAFLASVMSLLREWNMATLVQQH
ncbi:MAG: hypothetical protein MHM6MM_002529 [Cercozoa sp. M6MM]